MRQRGWEQGRRCAAGFICGSAQQLRGVRRRWEHGEWPSGVGGVGRQAGSTVAGLDEEVQGSNFF